MSSQMTKDFSLKSKLRKLADGGTFRPDEDFNTAEYQQNQLRDGGRVSGPGGRTDDKVGPVMLSDEEYVLPGDTADAIGREQLDAVRLATHEFKDKKKASALRGGAEELADGGSPWTVDSKGNVRQNAFGDAASRLPPPQPRTALVPTMGQRPPIDITPPGSGSAPPAQMAPDITDVKPKTMAGRAMGALRGAAVAGAPLAGIAGAANSFGDSASGYREKFQQNMGVETPMGSVAADAARVLSNVGDAATFGLAGRLGRGLAGIGNEGFVSGFMGDSDRDKFESARTAQVMNSGAAPAAPAAPTNTSALRSDQGPALPVAKGSYQSGRLSEMGVPVGVQNSNPILDANGTGGRNALRSAGTPEFQNLGSYGGNGNIYGRATDPARPGRMNSFAGVGAGASPANEVSGSGSTGGSTAAITSALRGLNGGGTSPGAQTQMGGMSVMGGEPDRFDKLIKELRGMYGAKGQGNLARKLVEVEQLRNSESNSLRNNGTSRDNAVLNSETSMRNTDVNARTNMVEALGRMEQNRATLGAQSAAAQLKALQDAQKTVREGEEKGFERYTGAIGNMFTTVDADGKQIQDKAAQERFRSFVEGSDPQAGKKFAAMAPQQQQVLLQNFKTMFDMNESRNKTAQTGSWPSSTGGVTNRMDMPVDIREATFNDYWNNNLPLKDYVWSNLPGTNPNVVQTESGQPVLYSDYTDTGGRKDLDKEKIVRDSVAARRSPLRSN